MSIGHKDEISLSAFTENLSVEFCERELFELVAVNRGYVKTQLVDSASNNEAHVYLIVVVREVSIQQLHRNRMREVWSIWQFDPPRLLWWQQIVNGRVIRKLTISVVVFRTVRFVATYTDRLLSGLLCSYNQPCKKVCSGRSSTPL